MLPAVERLLTGTSPAELIATETADVKSPGRNHTSPQGNARVSLRVSANSP